MGKSRWVALPDGYKSTRGDWDIAVDFVNDRKPECERFVRLAVISPPHFCFVFCSVFCFSPFFRHPEVPAFFVQFDGPARALSRTSKDQ